MVKSNLSVPIFELYLKLQMSLILLIILMIFFLFESMPNAISELTLYADREFYQDWWNSTSIEEFYGKWLRFPYLFYYRHVYMKLLIKYKMSPNMAKIITNLFNAASQELVMVSLFLQLISYIVHEFASNWYAYIQSLDCCNHLVYHSAQIQAILRGNNEHDSTLRILDSCTSSNHSLHLGLLPLG